MDGKTVNKNQNVYIASLPRSGSTLLGMILNQGKKCAYIGESFFWKKLNPKTEVCSCGILGCKILLKAYEYIKKNNNILKITDTLPILDKILQNGGITVKNIKKKYRKDIDNSCLGLESEAVIFRKLLNKKIIINSSSNIIIGEKIKKKFNWKIIILIRDPRGIIFSMKKAATRHKLKIPKDIWTNYAVDFIKRAKKLCLSRGVLIVKYETLCKNPKKEIKRICNFLQINFQKKMLRYRRNKGHVFMANRMRFGESETISEDKKWTEGLSDKEIKKIIGNKILVDYYSQFGYKFK